MPKSIGPIFNFKILNLVSDLSTLTASPCVTRFFHPSHGLTVGSSFLMVLQILSRFFPKRTVHKKTTQAAHSNAAEICISTSSCSYLSFSWALLFLSENVSENTY